MLHACATFSRVPECAKQFEQRFRTRTRLVDGMPEFIWNKVLRPVNPGDPYISSRSPGPQKIFCKKFGSLERR